MKSITKTIVTSALGLTLTLGAVSTALAATKQTPTCPRLAIIPSKSEIVCLHNNYTQNYKSLVTNVYDSPFYSFGDKRACNNCHVEFVP